MTTHTPCYVHPDTHTSYTTGHHLAGCNLTSCRGCVTCPTHATRPAQVPASNSDARKRVGALMDDDAS